MSEIKREEKPNIILIQADQLATNFLPSYNMDTKTIAPNLTRLADEGVQFNNCYCNSPLCSPSRMSMFSGTLVTKNEVWGNASEFRSDIPTMMHYLKDCGYRTVVSGKTHFIGMDQLHGFDKRLTTDIYPSDFQWSQPWRPNVKYRPGTSVKKLEVSGLCKTNNQILYDEEVHFRAKEFLRYEALVPKEEPFFLQVSYTQPHDSYQTVKKFWEMYENLDIDMPSQGPESEEEMHASTKWLRTHHGIDRYQLTDEIIKLSRKSYSAMITQIDEYIGELMFELEQLGLAEDTIVIFTSDHGDMMGERGMWFKRTFYDQSAKVPLIFHNPKRYLPKKCDNVVSLIDLCSTVAEIGYGIDKFVDKGNQDGSSFIKILNGDMPEWKNEAVIQYFGPGVEEPWFSIRKGDWKYIYTRFQEPLLFNMIEDPQEKNNLANKPELQEIVKSLHEKLIGDLDVEAIVEKAVKNKETRLFLDGAMKDSEGYKWDYQPFFDASKQYVRGVNLPSTC